MFPDGAETAPLEMTSVRHPKVQSLSEPGPPALHEDTINHRRLCGEGEFDIRGFLDQVWKAGYHGPVGIEVLNKELPKRPLDELAARSFSTTLAQFSA
jgi:sugar phosphate isomerase/epimerase